MFDVIIAYSNIFVSNCDKNSVLLATVFYVYNYFYQNFLYAIICKNNKPKKK